MIGRVDAKKLIEHLGGITAVHELFQRANQNITRKAVEKWSERGVMPNARLAKLVEIMRRKKKPIEVEKFIATK